MPQPNFDSVGLLVELAAGSVQFGFWSPLSPGASVGFRLLKIRSHS